METRYRALSFIAALYKVIGVLMAVFGILGGLAFIALGIFGGACDTSYPPEHCVVGFTGETGGMNAPRSQRSIEGKT